MKITDEIVAKAAGWKKNGKKQLEADEREWISPKGMLKYSVPAFTTSLDAIVAEIEAREIDIELKSEVTSKGYYYACLGDEIDKAKFAYADTAPLALCAALLAYLKDAK